MDKINYGGFPKIIKINYDFKLKKEFNEKINNISLKNKNTILDENKNILKIKNILR